MRDMPGRSPSRGAGVRITDCEWGCDSPMRPDSNQGGVVVGTAITDDIMAPPCLANSAEITRPGISGICPDAVCNGRRISCLRPLLSGRRQTGSGRAISCCSRFIARAAGHGCGAAGLHRIEWWPDDFDAIRLAVNRGIVVVEAAGTGARIGRPGVQPPSSGFPATWRNPFIGQTVIRRVLVGAEHLLQTLTAATGGPDRSRLDFSNYGRRSMPRDGTARYFDGLRGFQGGSAVTFGTTDTFSGTSSASPSLSVRLLRSGPCCGRPTR